MILPHHVKAQRPVQIEGGNLPRIDVLFASGHVFLHQCPDGLGDARPLSGLFYILVDPDASVLAFDRWHFTLRVEGAYHDKPGIGVLRRSNTLALFRALSSVKRYA